MDEMRSKSSYTYVSASSWIRLSLTDVFFILLIISICVGLILTASEQSSCSCQRTYSQITPSSVSKDDHPIRHPKQKCCTRPRPVRHAITETSRKLGTHSGDTIKICPRQKEKGDGGCSELEVSVTPNGLKCPSCIVKLEPLYENIELFYDSNYTILSNVFTHPSLNWEKVDEWVLELQLYYFVEADAYMCMRLVNDSYTIYAEAKDKEKDKLTPEFLEQCSWYAISRKKDGLAGKTTGEKPGEVWIYNFKYPEDTKRCRLQERFLKQCNNTHRPLGEKKGACSKAAIVINRHQHLGVRQTNKTSKITYFMEVSKNEEIIKNDESTEEQSEGYPSDSGLPVNPSYMTTNTVTVTKPPGRRRPSGTRPHKPKNTRANATNVVADSRRSKSPRNSARGVTVTPASLLTGNEDIGRVDKTLSTAAENNLLTTHSRSTLFPLLTSSSTVGNPLSYQSFSSSTSTAPRGKGTESRRAGRTSTTARRGRTTTGAPRRRTTPQN